MKNRLKKVKTQNQNKDKAKQIICLNTKEVFESISEASTKYGIATSTISKCCSGKAKFAGEIDGCIAIWMYYNEYLNLDDNRIKAILSERGNRKRNARKIICLNTNEIFDSTSEASEQYNIPYSTINGCCKKLSKSGGKINDEKAIWMYYDEYLLLNNNEKKTYLNQNNNRNKMIICLNTKEVFNSVADASRKYGITRTGISRCCRGECKTAGKVNGEKAVWMYYNNYLKLKEENIDFELSSNNIEIVTKINKEKMKNEDYKKEDKVICLNTNEIFNSISEASKQYNISYSNIRSCCNKVAKSAGRINNEKAIWMYYDEYLKLDNNQIEMILNENKNISSGNKIICLNTKEVFSSVTEAAKKYDICRVAISRCCRGISKTSGKVNGERASWMYYDEYLKLKEENIDLEINFEDTEFSIEFIKGMKNKNIKK